MTLIGYSGGDEAGREGIETVCRVCQTNGASPSGEEIIMGSVSVKRVNTIQRRGGGPEAVLLLPLRATRRPALSAATLTLPKNVCNPRTD